MKQSRTNGFIKAVAAVLSCGLCLSAGLLGAMAVKKMPTINGQTAYSNGFVYLQDSSDSLAFERIDESFFTPDGASYYTYRDKAKDWLMPGGSKEGTLTLGNHGSKACTIYLYAENSSDDKFRTFYSANGLNPANGDYTLGQMQYLSGLLASDENKLQLKIYRTSKDGKALSPEQLVYVGSIDGKGSNYDENNKLITGRENRIDGRANAIYLGTVYPDMASKYPNATNWSFPDLNDNVDQPKTITFRMELHAGTGIKSFLEGSEKSGFDAVRTSFSAQTGVQNGILQAGSTLTADRAVVSGNAAPAAKKLADDHGFAGASALFDWVFIGTSTPPTIPEDPPPPRTGEASIPYAAASAACLLSAGIIFAIAFRRRKVS